MPEDENRNSQQHRHHRPLNERTGKAGGELSQFLRSAAASLMLRLRFAAVTAVGFHH